MLTQSAAKRRSLQYRGSGVLEVLTHPSPSSYYVIQARNTERQHCSIGDDRQNTTGFRPPYLRNK